MMPAIRHARSDDLIELASVERSAASLFRDVGLAWLADGEPMDPALLAALCRDGTLWVAADELDEPAGFLAAHELDGVFHIAEVSIARFHQRQGLGARLIAAAVEHAKATGFGAVTLTTYRDLPWNGPYYSRLGFIEIDLKEAGPGHLGRLRAEAEAGHDPSRRCIMVLSLDSLRNHAGHQDAPQPCPAMDRTHLHVQRGVDLRLFSEADRASCQRIAALAALSSYGPRMPEFRERFVETQPLEPTDERIVAVRDGAVAGFLDLVGSHVSNLFVDPQHQGQGIGTALMAEAERRAAGDLTLSVFTVNPDARRLYERLGFVVEGVRTVPFAGSSAEVWVMRKQRQPLRGDRLDLTNAAPRILPLRNG